MMDIKKKGNRVNGKFLEPRTQVPPTAFEFRTEGRAVALRTDCGRPVCGWEMQSDTLTF